MSDDVLPRPLPDERPRHTADTAPSGVVIRLPLAASRHKGGSGRAGDPATQSPARPPRARRQEAALDARLDALAWNLALMRQTVAASRAEMLVLSAVLTDIARLVHEAVERSASP